MLLNLFPITYNWAWEAENERTCKLDMQSPKPIYRVKV